ncbi:hypothetical protein GA0115253_106835 [Streptomyces sp. Termitarium-T10T-6]|nr:hypothetical protein GA0115253_106835 [Streptomyces sp. Termitarium-T10T-6]
MLTLTTTQTLRRPPAGTGIPTEGLTTQEEIASLMDTQQVSAPPRAPSAGVVHINIRLTDGYTIISNRLSQHRGMSLLAIGVGTHIQSLPDGRRVGVKALAERFPESEVRIAAALRELEEHGFLRRTRVRAGAGSWPRLRSRTTTRRRRPGGACVRLWLHPWFPLCLRLLLWLPLCLCLPLSRYAYPCRSLSRYAYLYRSRSPYA